ncbi:MULTISPECIES: hypothetical protein [Nocardiaceae]|uniref:hypothetical protein n=1 Tax=Nocardiaceae TaxID=85025 RepID=UPI0005B47FC3|nr:MULTISPECIES: hypothetical protein [Rhodococcus]MCC8930774.1 hypothetical protein [Rhodococcus sp. I2R]MDJ0470950.1 hypothetical protein [Rhodococcus fascians]
MSDDHSNFNDQTQYQPPTRNAGMSRWMWIGVAIIVVLTIALVGVTTALVATKSDESNETASATTPAPSATPALTSEPSPSATPPPAFQPVPTAYVMDAAGWQGSSARCGAPESAVVTARTVDSLVVVCSGQAGLVYRGVWLADASPITIEQVGVVGRDYVATNSTVRHQVSATQLTVSSGNSILTQSPFVEYRGGTPSVGAPATTSLRPTTRGTVPQQPGSSPEQQDSPGPCAYNGCDEFESYGEYSSHFQCVVFNVSSDECRRLIEKYGTETG